MCSSPTLLVNSGLKNVLLYHPIESFSIMGISYRCISQFDDIRKSALYFLSRTREKLGRNLTSSELSDCTVFASDGTTFPLFLLSPCGKCDECLVNKRQEILNRCILEYASNPQPPIFFTLTYDDAHLPSNGVSREDVTRFVNRLHIELRKHFDYCLPVRFLIFSEYGSDPRYTFRPHYHGLLFGLPCSSWKYKDYQLFRRCLVTAWSVRGVPLASIFDFSVARDHVATIRYVTKYILKQYKSNNVPDGKNPNFYSTPHRGGSLGTNYFCSHFKDFLLSVYGNSPLKVRTPSKVISISVPSIFRKRIYQSVSSTFDKSFFEAFHHLVVSHQDCNLPLFDNYPLLVKKSLDYSISVPRFYCSSLKHKLRNFIEFKLCDYSPEFVNSLFLQCFINQIIFTSYDPKDFSFRSERNYRTLY